MEPLSARGLPRLSWIDTLYSSTYLSSITLLLSTHHFSFICALYLSVFCPAPPSSLSHPLPVRVTAPAICTQGTLCIFRTSNQCALLWLSITRHSTQGHHTHTHTHFFQWQQLMPTAHLMKQTKLLPLVCHLNQSDLGLFFFLFPFFCAWMIYIK